MEGFESFIGVDFWTALLILVCAITETTGIYSLLISFLILFALK